MEELFYSEQHREFYRHHVDGGADPYYRALVYLLGVTEETRANFSRCFDGEARMIRPAALGEGWQTGGTARIVRMAFNLWNGWCYESEEDAQEGRMSEAFTPDNLFCCEFAPSSMRQSSCGIQNIRTTPGSELSKPAGPSDRWEARRNTACPGGELHAAGRIT